jgi:hypothetical protein
MSATNGRQPYTVSTPPGIRQQFRQWGELAARLGLFREYLADLRLLNELLLYAPKRWGDPLQNFQSAKLRSYRGLTEYLVVTYAVHTERQVVFIKEVTLRSDRPLGRAERYG